MTSLSNDMATLEAVEDSGAEEVTTKLEIENATRFAHAAAMRGSHQQEVSAVFCVSKNGTRFLQEVISINVFQFLLCSFWTKVFFIGKFTISPNLQSPPYGAGS